MNPLCQTKLHSKKPTKACPKLTCPMLAKRRCAIVLLVASSIYTTLLGSPAVAGAIYKSIDKDGKIVFTDQPVEGAESVNKAAKDAAATRAKNAAPAQNIQESDQESDQDTGTPQLGAALPGGVVVAPAPKNPPKPKYKAPEEAAPPPFLPITRVEILTPAHNATLNNPPSKIWVELQSYPTPIVKHGLVAQLWLNGQMIDSGSRPLLSLPTLEPGTHILQVKLVDDEGRLYVTSRASTLHVK